MRCGFVSVLGDEVSILITPDGAPIEMSRSPTSSKVQLIVRNGANDRPFIGIGYMKGSGQSFTSLYDSGTTITVTKNELATVLDDIEPGISIFVVGQTALRTLPVMAACIFAIRHLIALACSPPSTATFALESTASRQPNLFVSSIAIALFHP